MQTKSPAYFAFAQPGARWPFVIKLYDDERIDHARAILRGERLERVRPQGTIDQHRVPYNPGYSFNLMPASISFFEQQIEVCDANMADLEEHWDEIGGSLLPRSRWCPWSAEIVAEVTDLVKPDEAIDRDELVNRCARAMQARKATPAWSEKQSDDLVSVGIDLSETLAISGFPGVTPKSMQLFYVRGVGHDSSGHEGVAFPPTFVWVIDVGARDLLGVSIGFNSVGYGDPAFPDFSRTQLQVHQDWTVQQVIKPGVAGMILVTFKTEPELGEALALLNRYGVNAEQLIGRHFTVRTSVLKERETGEKLLREQPTIEGWGFNTLLRSNVVQWRVDVLAKT